MECEFLPFLCTDSSPNIACHKKGEVISQLHLQIGYPASEKLVSELPPQPCKPDQPKAKKQHGGWLRDEAERGAYACQDSDGNLNTLAFVIEPSH
jgi:hypothetical protein